MNRKWFRLLMFVPLVALLVITNYYEDPANVFHNESKSMAEYILNGNKVYFESGNCDERAVKRGIIEGMPKHVECLTMGPSLSMGIRNSNVGTNSYYNLSASSLNFYEYLALFGMLELNDIKFDRVVFCIDTYFFDENMYSLGSRNIDMMQYANYMISLLNDEIPERPREVKIEQYKMQFAQAFSLTYFQSAIGFIQKNNSYVVQNERWGIMDANSTNLAYYLPDASLVYSLNYQSKTEKDVLDESASYAIEREFSKGNHISEYSMIILEKLLDYYKKKNVEVEFYLCPLSPALWDRLQNEPDANCYYILDELENFALEIADEYNIKVTGSYNPYNIGISNCDFWDARHVRHDRLEQYFDFR